MKETEVHSELSLLKEQSFLQGLSEEQILLLKERSHIEKALPNELILEEGELTNDVYLILEGDINILKWDEDHCAQLLIGKLSKGETFGEMSFMDNSPRSTTIKAAKPSTLMKISKETLTSSLNILSQIYANIAIININRLRLTNEIYVKNLQERQQTFQIRQNIGTFLLYLYLIFGLIVALTAYAIAPPMQLYFPWIAAVIPAIIMMKNNQFPFSRFGMSLQNWKSILATSLMAAVFIIGSVFIADSFFSKKQTLGFQWSLKNDLQPLSAWPLYALYCFSMEFVARGVFQTAFQEFTNDQKGLKSLFINAIFLFILLLPLGLRTAFPLFLLSLPLGLIYLNHKSILGVGLLHFLLLVLGILKL